MSDNSPPDSEWLQPPQGPRLDTSFTRLIVDYPEEAKETQVFGLSVDLFTVWLPLTPPRSFKLTQKNTSFY